jgi:hypothetical protein
MAANDTGPGQTEAGMMVQKVLLGTCDATSKTRFLTDFFNERGRLYQTKMPTLKDLRAGRKTVPDIVAEATVGGQIPLHLVARKTFDGPKQARTRLNNYLFAAQAPKILAEIPQISFLFS